MGAWATAAIIADSSTPDSVELLVVPLVAAGWPVHVVVTPDQPDPDLAEACGRAGATVTIMAEDAGEAGALHVAFEAATSEWLLVLTVGSGMPGDTPALLTASSALLDPRVAAVVPAVRDAAGGDLLQGDPEATSWYPDPDVQLWGGLWRVAAVRDVGGVRTELHTGGVADDLCRRLHASGWTTVVEPSALALHTHRPLRHAARAYYDVRNPLLLARDATYGLVPARALTGALSIAGTVLRAAREPGRRDAVRAVGRGIADGIGGRGGPRPVPPGWRPRSGPPRGGEREPVSVCMATFNGIDHVTAQVDSILSQLGPFDELLVQDDASTDATVDLLSSYGDPRIVIERNVTNAGVITTFERALARAAHSIVFLSDQDDEWLPGKVDATLAAFADPEVMAVVTDAVVVDETGRHDDRSFFAHRGSGPGVIHNFVKNSYLGCCMAVRREVLRVALPVPRSVRTHDGWLGICADMLGTVTFLDTPYVRYRRHGANVSPMSRFGLVDVAARRFHLAMNLLRITPAVLHRR
jgi:GT2 family glycosyltransferase